MTAKYPAREHTVKLIDELAKVIPESDRGKTHGIFLQGSPTLFRDDTDREMLFHQEANFNYLTGVIQASCSVAIFFSLSSDASTSHVEHHLFIPAADPAETMWSVPPPTLAEAQAKYDSDKIDYTSAIPSFLDSAVKSFGGSVIMHTLPETMDYPALPETLLAASSIDRNTNYLFEALHIARLTKDESEIALIREANRISSAAHEVVMRELGSFARQREGGGLSKGERTGKEALRQWEIESEDDAEAVFVAACRRLGAQQAYLPIVASGTRASTLHYVCNDRLFPSTAVPRQPGDTSFIPSPLVRGCCGTLAPPHSHEIEPTAFHDKAFFPQVLLIDAGCEWQGYASDITRTIPVGNGGKYTKEGGEIYELVLRMQKECEALIKPGVHWDTIHLHGHKVLIDGFLTLGIFKGDAEAILQSGVSAGFFPHGLGHSLGLDVHDSRQYLKSTFLSLPLSSTSTPSKLYTYLRIRQPLLLNMILTVEPGCYFAPQLLEEHGVWTNEYVVTEVLKRYVNVGGVRIEDVVVVRENGVENLTTIGRERDYVEAICAGEL